MKEIIIEGECELTEGDYPDKYDWIDTLQDLIYKIEEQPEDYIPTEIIATIQKSEWEEIEKGKVIKTKPSLKVVLK